MALTSQVQQTPRVLQQNIITNQRNQQINNRVRPSQTFRRKNNPLASSSRKTFGSGFETYSISQFLSTEELNMLGECLQTCDEQNLTENKTAQQMAEFLKFISDEVLDDESWENLSDILRPKMKTICLFYYRKVVNYFNN